MTCHTVSFCYLYHPGPVFFTTGNCFFATRTERTTARYIHWTGYFPFQSFTLILFPGIRYRDCLHKRLRVRVKWVFKQAFFICQFYSLPKIHYQDSVTDMTDNTHVM